MFEKFTATAREAVINAEVQARALGLDATSPAMLLAGLCNGEGLAAKVLDSLEITTDKIQEIVQERSGEARTPAESDPADHLPYTNGSKVVLELSLREALSLGHNYIGTEHILLALVRHMEDGDEVATILGADETEPGEGARAIAEVVRTEIIRALSRPGRNGKAGAAAGSGPRFVASQRIEFNQVKKAKLDSLPDGIRTALMNTRPPGAGPAYVTELSDLVMPLVEAAGDSAALQALEELIRLARSSQEGSR